MSQHIFFLPGDIELMFQPDLKKLSINVKTGGMSRTLSKEEMIRLSKALWYAAASGG
jgi:hypothetical protein